MAGVFAIVIWSAMMLAPEFVCSLFGKGDEALISYGAMAMKAARCSHFSEVSRCL